MTRPQVLACGHLKSTHLCPHLVHREYILAAATYWCMEESGSMTDAVAKAYRAATAAVEYHLVEVYHP